MELLLVDEQVDTIREKLIRSTVNPSLVIIDDGQSISHFAEVLTGVRVNSWETKDQVAHLRVSDSLPTGISVLQRFRDVSNTCAWIILHIGGNILPPTVLSLMAYVFEQEFDHPRIAIVVEELDLACGDEQLLALFNMGPATNLVMRTEHYYRSLLKGLKVDEPFRTMLAQFHYRLQALAVEDYSKSTRRLDAAATFISTSPQQLSFTELIDLVYFGGDRSSEPEAEAISDLLEAVQWDED
jgi:hypothetical protein